MTPPKRNGKRPVAEPGTWQPGLARPNDAKDAVEFTDVHKAFGRNQILRG